MPLALGSKLAGYEIIAPLGAGGMGEVYLARDTRLGREVAVKVLPAAMVLDATARARLLREARLAATLNHPNICTVHDVGEAGEHVYLAMERVEGHLLRDRIAQHRSGLPSQLVVRYGVQIAAALSHAHERQVTHRDLKSSNIMVTPDGLVKVLDFGLARRAADADELEDAETVTMLTHAGAIAGTPQYLAPEVLRGEPQDARADVWALGVLLHEMASGGMPFRGKTPHELSGAILHEAPAPLSDRVPARLRAVIHRCLEKETERRYRRAADVRAELETLQAARSAPETRPTRLTRGVWAVGVALTAILVLLGVWRALRPSGRPLELLQRQLTTAPAENPVVAAMVSPDGHHLVYMDGNGVHLRDVDSDETRDIAMPAGYTVGGLIGYGSWFPDGAHALMTLADSAGSPAMWSIPILGGAPRRVGDGGHGMVSPDGARIAFLRSGPLGNDIWCMDTDGEGPRRVAGSDSSGFIQSLIAWSPRASRIAYARLPLVSAGPRRMRLESCDLSGQSRVAFTESAESRLHPMTSAAWLPDGRLVFPIYEPPPAFNDMNLWTLHVDPRTGVPSGNPRRLTQWLHITFPYVAGATRDGKRLAVDLVQYESDVFIGRLGRADSALTDVRRLTLDERTDVEPSWLSDNRTVLFTSNREGRANIFRQRIDETTAQSIAVGPRRRNGAHVTSDGAWILYWEEVPVSEPHRASDAADTLDQRLMRIPAAGGMPAEILRARPSTAFACPRSAHSLCVLGELQPGGIAFSALDPTQGRGRVLARFAIGIVNTWDLSPAGEQVAMLAQDSIPRIFIGSLADGSIREVRLALRGNPWYVTWTANGDGWFVTGPTDRGSFLLVRVAPDGTCTPLQPPAPWMYGCEPSPDGRLLAFTRNLVSSNVWLLDGL